MLHPLKVVSTFSTSSTSITSIFSSTSSGSISTSSISCLSSYLLALSLVRAFALMTTFFRFVDRLDNSFLGSKSLIA